MGGAYIMCREMMHTGFWCGGLREGVNLEDPGLDGKIILECILKK
jgi:hypothetical protein